MLVALDDGPAPPIKYQCVDFTKLYQCVSLLIRFCDVSQRCSNSVPEEPPMAPNPYTIQPVSADFPQIPLQPEVADLLSSRGYDLFV